jgi:hypothetical protein
MCPPANLIINKTTTLISSLLINRALRLRWQWLRWKHPNKPWSRLPLQQSQIEQLFRTCTTVAIGNGSTAKFYHDPWLHGQAPKEIALAVFRLGWRKGLTVAQGLQGRTWMRGLRCISIGEEVLQFVNLWHIIRDVTLMNLADVVTWRFTPNGQYTASSAYDAQFCGS